ncbi:hypothetical protein IAQ61_000916 [Plenodomus lingam]|uniref:uncharacterized protein n=1 Tax=Leptosphaeria maculans TaxID=5022 RepID=UPI003322E140|nr:hypothetical protein IAQ61_000916 [Plenodomus lingam]
MTTFSNHHFRPGPSSNSSWNTLVSHLAYPQEALIDWFYAIQSSALIAQARAVQGSGHATLFPGQKMQGQ